MKYILGIICLIVGIMFYVKPEAFTDNINCIYGCIFILLGNLFFNKKDDRER